MRFKPLVTVLINNYNKEKFCSRAVKSLLEQSYKKIEIIFFDDGSHDASLEKINQFRKKIKVIKNFKRGKIFSYNQLSAIKRSLNKSKGNIICILDSDDFFEKKKVGKIVDYFSKNKSAEILCDKPRLFYNKSKIINEKKVFFKRSYKWPKFPPTSCLSFKKNSLKKALNIISKNKFEELWFDFRVVTYFALKKKQFNVLNEYLTFYRQDTLSFDKKYKKFYNFNWWRRRDQAFEFIRDLDQKSYRRNLFTIDFIITKLISKIFAFFKI
tara:strand:+ start:114 stop:920 length:807 start_codon:yes stop_codon:yes gene_type:complete